MLNPFTHKFSAQACPVLDYGTKDVTPDRGGLQSIRNFLVAI